MKFLAFGSDTPSAQASDFQPYLHDEAARVLELKESGFIKEIFFRADRRDAIILLEAGDEEQVQQILASLPLVKKNLIRFELIPLKPYDGFDLLSKINN